MNQSERSPKVRRTSESGRPSNAVESLAKVRAGARKPHGALRRTLDMPLQKKTQICIGSLPGRKP